MTQKITIPHSRPFLDDEEMRAAAWFTREDIANRKATGFNIPPHDSIARKLIDDWIAEAD